MMRIAFAEPCNIQLLIELIKVAFNGCAKQVLVPDLVGDDRNPIKAVLSAAVG
ncbi:hypothetical protein PV433_07345 [Paenibacillus sp. GYB004]|uniref:hypothetical protein n=1 Tax=Paenibacillus sp. GYB004 TaxID=2994393 RepID=UPI002F96A2C6